MAQHQPTATCNEKPIPRTLREICPMAINRGAREKIRAFLIQQGFAEGRNCIFAA